MMTPSFCVGAGALSGFLTVALGAFGAHALREKLEPRALEVYQTAVQYQGVHALALILVGAWFAARPESAQGWAGAVAPWGFLVGMLLFSGSLYVLALTGVRWWGAVTPLGGVAFLLGWFALAWTALANRGSV